MNKRAARKLALEGRLSIGDLRELIRAARGREDEPSQVNPEFSMKQVLDIYEGALARRDDDEVPAAWKPDVYSPSGRMRPTRDVLTITNILRDCAQ